jgi:hypothetical protein
MAESDCPVAVAVASSRISRAIYPVVGLSLNRNNQKAENISVKPNYMFPVRILD